MFLKNYTVQISQHLLILQDQNWKKKEKKENISTAPFDSRKLQPASAYLYIIPLLSRFRSIESVCAQDLRKEKRQNAYISPLARRYCREQWEGNRNMPLARLTWWNEDIKNIFGYFAVCVYDSYDHLICLLKNPLYSSSLRIHLYSIN